MSTTFENISIKITVAKFKGLSWQQQDVIKQYETPNVPDISLGFSIPSDSVNACGDRFPNYKRISRMHNKRINTDKRILAAADMYESFSEGAVKVYKTTRAGCTTSLGAEAINRGEKTLLVVPTNKIAKETICQDIPKYCDIKDVKITHVVSNRSCIRIQQMMNECVYVKRLETILLPINCKKCEYFNKCEVTELVRNPDSDIIVLTSRKLAIMMQKFLSSHNKDDIIQDFMKIIFSCRNIIFDEVHELEYIDMINIPVYGYDVEKDVLEQVFKLEKYKEIANNKDDFPELNEILFRFIVMMTSKEMQENINNVLDMAKSKEYVNQHMRKIMLNPYFSETCDVPQYKIFVGGCDEILKLTQNAQKYEIDISDILDLFDIMKMALSKYISVGAIRSGKRISAVLSSCDTTITSMLKEFIEIVNNRGYKRIILTSATIDDSVYNYDEFVGCTPKNVLFGGNGDPLCTNDKMLILADTKKYHRSGKNSVTEHLGEICEHIIELFEEYGKENCFIIAVNIDTALQLENMLKRLGYKNLFNDRILTYYGSTSTIGVRCDSRICITVGLSYKPSNAFDTITSSLEESRCMCEVTMHADTWQGISRVKDPEGKNPSVVVCLGTRLQECANVTSWGSDRHTIIGEQKAGKKTSVTVTHNNDIIPVGAIECKGWDAMKIAVKMYIGDSIKKRETEEQSDKAVTENGVKVLYNNNFNYRTLPPFSVTGSLESWVNDNLLSDNLPEDVIKSRIEAGEVPAYTTTKEGLAKWVLFCDVGNDRFKLCGELSKYKISYMLEEFQGTYYVRALMAKNTTATAAKRFAKGFAKEAKVKCADIYPKQVSTRNGRGDIIMLPFGDGQKAPKIIFSEFFEVKEVVAD